MSENGACVRSPLRVLQLASHGNLKRGGAVQLARLAVELRRRGHESFCALNVPAQEAGDTQFDLLRERGVEVLGFDMNRRRERARFRRWCLERDIQLVHAHRDQALVFAWRALWRLSRPVLVAGRGTVYPLKRFRWPWFCFRSRKVRLVTPVAEAVKSSLVQRGVSAEKIKVVYGSVDEGEFRPGLEGGAIREEWGVESSAPLVGNIAALRGKKGLDPFLYAAAVVRERIPNCRFVLVGSGARQKLKRLMMGLDLNEAVIFAGYRSDLPRVMSALDVVVSSSVKGEGLNGAIREAMACGRPVIATAIAGNGEIVRDGHNGRLVPAQDIEALAEAIVEVLEHPELAHKYGRAARQTIQERFTNRQRGARMEQLYRSLLSSD